jgi:hypothetical protein
MTKNEWIWMAIRVSGLYLMVMAIMGVPELFASAYRAYTFWDYQPPSSSGDIGNIAYMVHRLSNSQFASFIGYVARVAFLWFIGRYLLRDGKMIYNMVGSIPDRDPAGQTGDTREKAEEA